MDQQDSGNFLDRRTLMAVALVGIVWFGWQAYLGKKYPQSKNATPVVTEGVGEQKGSDPQKTSAGALAATEPMKVQNSGSVEAPNLSQPEKLISYENDSISFELSSRGMGLKNVILKKHNDRNHQPMKMGYDENGFSLFSASIANDGSPMDFVLTQKNQNLFEGVYKKGGLTVRRELLVQPETGALENKMTVEGIDSSFAGAVVTIPERKLEAGSHGFLMPSFEHQEYLVLHSGKEERVNITSLSEKLDETFSSVSTAGVSSQYFSSALVDKSELVPEVRLLADPTAPYIISQVIYKPSGGSSRIDLNWISYTGPKSVAQLESIDKNLGHVVNYGFFTAIARFLLVLLQWFHGLVGNWGLSIILLTLMVRVVVLPLNVTTFRSTKKMQKLQPIIQSVRERYKDDPQTMNREVMGLWKEHKVNPLGGCLPMLLQLPVFFALYQVLGQSIELYQVPFFGWINDLSLKDPYYILPVLMGVAMYLQQKMTPTAMDPTQAKVMQFLPVVFALMMVSLPAGLTLYIFVNTLAGIILQRVFMRDRTTSISTKEVKV